MEFPQTGEDTYNECVYVQLLLSKVFVVLYDVSTLRT